MEDRIQSSRYPQYLFFVLAVFAVSFVSCNRGSGGSLQIVSKGESSYTVLIPADASMEEIRAADFLVSHLTQISGCYLPIVKADTLWPGNFISISKSNDFEGGDDFSITTDGKNLYIKGGSHKGCVYGVTEILGEYLGVRYYSPHHVVIPQSENIKIPALDVRDSTPNTYRNVHGAFVADEDYKDFNRLHNINDMFASGYFVHTFHRLLPWTEYFEDHPEYYAFMNGKRMIGQLCLTNENVFNLVVDKLRNEMLLQPGKQVWSVSQDDNTSYCQCDGCSRVTEEEQSPAGPIIRFVNRVAEQFPEKVISTLAYQYSRQAPVITKPLDNVQVMLCTIELNRSKPIATDPTSVSFLKDLEDWGKIANRIFLWDYTVNFNHHINPFPNLHTLQPNIQLFVRNNVKEHFQQSNTGTAHEFSELKSYLLAKLLWNPDADKRKIIEEFTDGYYGAASPWIRKYMDAMEAEILKTGEWLDIYGPPTNHQHTFLSAENTEKYNLYFDEAENAAAGSPDHLLHLRTARMSLQYAIMEIGKTDMFGPRGWYVERDGEFHLRQDMTNMLDDFYQTSIDCNAAVVSEAGLTASEYYHSTWRILDVQVEGNHAFRKTVVANPPPTIKYSEGDLTLLTNGVRGGNHFHLHWLGWDGQDFTLVLDLESLVEATDIEISTLWDKNNWILHPRAVSCWVSSDGVRFMAVGRQEVADDQQKIELQKLFGFKAPKQKFRYVKFEVNGTIQLPVWHPAAGGGSWVFVDEIVVK